MLLRGTRYVQILPLLIAVCRLTLGFPTPTPSAFNDFQQLHVKIPHSGPVSAPLGSSISIPCLVSLSSIPASSSSSPVALRVQWTVVSDGVETQILVARGERVKINEEYRDRAVWLNYTSSPDDLSLWLGDLRSSDSGHYRCEVQQGLEIASDVVQLKVKGVVFHYRDSEGRYAYSFNQAQRVCEAIGAQIATPDQLLAAYYDGYEQCNAGWLSDQSVRYPIHKPREECYGDMDSEPGVRNYGTMNQDQLYDVYCYVEEIHGEVFHDSTPQKLSFDEAQLYCRAAGAQLATAAQLYFAWSNGLDCCSPGWLSDGSVRYPITTPRNRCGGPQAGVRTLYRFRNQTGFPDPSSSYDAYCFKDRYNHIDSPMDHAATEPEDIVILMEADQELHLNQHAEHVELKAEIVVESFPLYPSPTTEKNLPEAHSALSDTTESSLNTTTTVELLQALDETSSPTERIQGYSQHPAAVKNSTISNAKAYDTPPNTSLQPSVYNETDAYNTLNFTFHEHEAESTTGYPASSYEPQTQNQTDTDRNPKENTEPSEMPEVSQEWPEINLNFSRSPANHSETSSNHTEERSFWEATLVTLDSMVQVKPEEAAVKDSVLTFLSTEVSKGEDELVTQPARIRESSIKAQTSTLDGSGDISQESDLDVDAVSLIPTSESSSSTFTSLPSPSASAHVAPTSLPGVIPLPGSSHSDNLGLDILSTASQFWESSILKEEGSTSLEIEESIKMENEDKQLHVTNLFSGVSLATTESLDGLDASQLLTDATTDRSQTGYTVHLDTATTGYEEASGHEPDIVTAVLGEDAKVSPTIKENDNIMTEEDNKVNITLQEEVTVTLTLEEEMRVSPTLKSKAEVFMSPTLEGEVKVAPTATVASEEEADVTSVFEEQVNISPTLEDETNVTPTIEEDTTDTATVTKEAFVSQTLEEDFTVFSLSSKTSNWALLTTTTGPQESLNNLEYSRKDASVPFTVLPDSLSSTKPTAATTKTSTPTVTTTTHWSGHAWSPTTPTPKVFQKTTEPQMVTASIPPVDQGLVDVEFSLTQPPTVFILPNEMAAVGGTGTASDACEDDPCLNGGTCTDQDGQIRCLCLPTYGGDFCQTDVEQCEPGWDKFHGFCYRHFSQRLSWEVAEQRCRMLGAHLVSIMTPEEQNYINSNYKEYQWTGLNDKTIEDDFHWSDGNPLLYENWYRGQPDSYFLSGEDCVVMVWHDGGRWSDVPCNYHLAYTCKKGTSSCGPPPKVRNTSIFGKVRQRYETNAIVRYHCARGFQQRLNPLIRCLSGGRWERPQILCTPEAGSPTQHPEESTKFEDDVETPSEAPQYWDIKF